MKLPIIFISSRDNDMDIIMSINMGGDDYITKPFSPQVLVAKIQAILRRTYSYNKDLKSDIIKFKDVTLNIVEGKIYFKDEKLFKIKFNKIISKGEKVMETKKGTPIVTEMQVIPVAGYDSMLMTLSGAHAPYFTRNIVILEDSNGNKGAGEVPGGEGIRKTLEDATELVVGQSIGNYKNTGIGEIHGGDYTCESLRSCFRRKWCYRRSKRRISSNRHEFNSSISK